MVVVVVVGLVVVVSGCSEWLLWLCVFNGRSQRKDPTVGDNVVLP